MVNKSGCFLFKCGGKKNKHVVESSENKIETSSALVKQSIEGN